MSKVDPFGPVTVLTGLAFDVSEGTGNFAPIYPPNLTTDQVLEIPVTTYLPGAIVFNTNTEELEYTALVAEKVVLLSEVDFVRTDSVTSKEKIF